MVITYQETFKINNLPSRKDCSQRIRY